MTHASKNKQKLIVRRGASGVVARTSTFSFKNKHADLRIVGE
jgi:TolB-like protein